MTMILDYLGLSDSGAIKRNLTPEELFEDAIRWGEGKLGLRGVLMVDTGKYTGRSPQDKYFVREDHSGAKLWWGPVNQPTDETIFNELLNKVIEHYKHNADEQGTYVVDGYCGADPDYRCKVRIVARKAWQAIFAQNMFLRPGGEELGDFQPDFTIINASAVVDEAYQKHGHRSKTFIIFNLKRRLAIIGGTEYGGEMKKGIFSIMHYYLPLKGVLSMHCAANVNEAGEDPALFFGLSGTGKTTLSTDPTRPLIGDDEHGWSDSGIFNFEGGCYAKAINLDPREEPEIYAAIRHGALAENVVFDQQTREIDFSDQSKTENTRICYPIEFISNSLAARGQLSRAGHPSRIIFLACDAYGVLPPVARLTPPQAMYHFISGYTAKVAGTERGITEPVATFSPCYSGPFLTLHPTSYARLLSAKMQRHQVSAYLVNTGWVGASASSGARRISLPVTRSIIHAILNGELEKAEYENDPYFGFQVPRSLGNLDVSFLIPRQAWQDQEAYQRSAASLVEKFTHNFAQFDLGDQEVSQAGPRITPD